MKKIEVKIMLKRLFLLSFVVAVAGGILAFSAPSAQAGNIWLTGHDADFHCRGGAQCNHFGIAVDFARQDAPDPTKPILVLDRSDLDVVAALGQAVAKARNTVEGAGNPFPYVVMDPRGADFAAEPLLVSSYSAIVIASDTTCGGCDLNAYGSTPDSDAINARSSDIADFFNDGGGLVYFSGAGNRAVYYASVPIPAAAVAVSPPFTLTPEGVAIGLLDPADTNCCATHNSFQLPEEGSPLVVAEIDDKEFAETLYAGNVRIGEGGFEEEDGEPPTVPEPSSLLLLGSGLLGFSIFRKVRRTK